MNTWIFQGNPRDFDINSYISKNKIVSWNIRQARYTNQIKINDKVYIWRSNGRQPGGIVAYGKVIKEAYQNEEYDNVDIEIIEYRLTKEDGMLLREDLKKDIITSNLSIIKQPTGTNYQLTQEQSTYLNKLWNNEHCYNFQNDNIEKKYFYEFKNIADEWFDKYKDSIEEDYKFFKKFKSKEFLDNIKWEDIQDLGNHINAFNSLPLAKGRALGKLNHTIEHYAKSFKYLIYGEDELKERMDKFTFDKDYKLFGFGDAVLSELLGNLYPDELCFYNIRDKFALENIFKVNIEISKGDTFADRFIKFNKSINDNKIKDLYLEIVGKKTNLPLNYEIDQLFSYLYETYKDRIVTKYWSISAGENGFLWDEFLEKEEIRIGWDLLGNLENYKDKKAILENLKEHIDNENPMNDALANYQFAKEMQIGDIVIVKRGYREILGIGRIVSEYFYDDNKPLYKHTRNVEWIKTQSSLLTGDDKFAQKTLTDITKFTELVDKIMKLVNGEGVVSEEEQEYFNYTKEEILQDIFMEEDKIDLILFNLDYKKNIILQGPPGVGKTFVAKKLCYLHQGRICNDQIEMVQFHQSYSYEDFIRGYRPNKAGGFALKDGVFYKFTQKAINDPDNNYYFIIDEINRGNLSKIFGELMMLIEKDKRGEAYKVSLTYQEDDEKFYIPKNLYIIGTMNTADRSLAMVDYALRRRFAFIDIEPAFNNNRLKEYFVKYLGNEMSNKIINKITSLNKVIEKDSLDLGKGYRIGHSYFTPTEKINDVESWYKRIVKMEIEPLIREYWFDKTEEELLQKVDDLLED